MQLYVGNLPFKTDSDELRDAFAEFGTVRSAKVVMDRDTGRSKGFGFVEFEDSRAGMHAIAAMNGHNMGGRVLVVNEARQQNSRR